jgi:hypothetical protein
MTENPDDMAVDREPIMPPYHPRPFLAVLKKNTIRGRRMVSHGTQRQDFFAAGFLPK